MVDRERFVTNTAALGISAVVSTVLTLAQVKILASSLTVALFGSFAAMRGFSLLLSLIAANGFPQLLVRFHPYHEARKQPGSAIVLAGVCLLAPLLLLTVVVFVVEALRSTFFVFLVPGTLNANLLVWFYATTLGVTLKLVIYAGLNGLRRLGLQVFLELVSLAVQVTWIFVWREQLTLERLFMILALVSLGAVLVGLPLYLWRLGRDTRGPTQTAQPVSLAEYRSYWFGATGLSVVAAAFTDVDRFVLSSALALEMISLFHIGSKITRLVHRFLSVPVLAFQPEVTRLWAERRENAIETSTRVFIKFNAAASVLALGFLAVLPGEIIRIVSNAQYDSAVPLLLVLSAAIPLSSLTAPITTVMKALDRVGRAFFCDLAWAVIYLVLLVVLGRAMGLIGAGVALLCATVAQLLLAAALSSTAVGGGFLAATLGRVALAGCGAFAPALVLGWVSDASWWQIGARVALAVLAVPVYRVLLARARLFDGDERSLLAALLERRGLGLVARRLP